MLRFPYFVQECPICGRSAEVRVVYLGSQVRCRHCRGQFTAFDPSGRPEAPAVRGNRLLHRAEQLLDISTGGSHSSHLAPRDDTIRSSGTREINRDRPLGRFGNRA